MKIFKTFITVIAADILSLFICMTLAVSASTMLRIISAVCSVGILICVLGSFAAKQAYIDEKKGGCSPLMTVCMGITASLPCTVSWLILKFSGADVYRWHKLINGYFLQIFNFIEPDASSAALSDSEMLAMLPLCIVPAVIFFTGYLIGRKGARKEKIS